MASTYRSTLLVDLNPGLKLTFEVNTSSEAIQPGDLLELNLSTGQVALLEDDEVTAGCKFVGISDSYWKSDINDAADRNEIEVVGVCIVEAVLASATYAFGEALDYDASNDDGRLKSFTTGNQLIGWFWEFQSSAVTSGKVLIDITDPSSGLLEVSS